jgi:hypothetical protein
VPERQQDLAYLALGDWHGTRQVDAQCWYVGTPETDRFRDNDSGHALLVAIDGPGAPPRVRAELTEPYRWVTPEHALACPTDIGELTLVTNWTDQTCAANSTQNHWSRLVKRAIRHWQQHTAKLAEEEQKRWYFFFREVA